MRLYLRLGFVPIETDPFYIEMESQAPAVSHCPEVPCRLLPASRIWRYGYPVFA